MGNVKHLLIPQNSDTEDLPRKIKQVSCSAHRCHGCAVYCTVQNSQRDSYSPLPIKPNAVDGLISSLEETW